MRERYFRSRTVMRVANASRTATGDALTHFISMIIISCEAFPAGKVTYCFFRWRETLPLRWGTAAVLKCHGVAVFLRKEVSKKETLRECKNQLPILEVVQEPRICVLVIASKSLLLVWCSIGKLNNNTYGGQEHPVNVQQHFLAARGISIGVLAPL